MAETHKDPKFPDSQNHNEQKDQKNDMNIEREYSGRDQSEDVEREPAASEDERAGRMANHTSVRHREDSHDERAA